MFDRQAAIRVIKSHLIACRDACNGKVGSLVFEALKDVPQPSWPSGCGPEPDEAINMEPISLEDADGLDLYVDSLSREEQTLFDFLYAVYSQSVRCTPAWAVKALRNARKGYPPSVAPTMMSRVKFWNDADFNRLVEGLK